MSSLVYTAGQDETCPDCGNIATVPVQVTVEPTQPLTIQKQLPQRKPVSRLGTVSFVLGIFAVLGCLIAPLNIYSISMAALGFIFGAISFFVALIGRKAGTGMPAAGVLFSIVAIAISICFLLLYLYFLMYACVAMLECMAVFLEAMSVLLGGAS